MGPWHRWVITKTVMFSRLDYYKFSYRPLRCTGTCGVLEGFSGCPRWGTPPRPQLIFLDRFTEENAAASYCISIGKIEAHSVFSKSTMIESVRYLVFGPTRNRRAPGPPPSIILCAVRRNKEFLIIFVLKFSHAYYIKEKARER